MLKYGIQLVRFLVENKHTLATIDSIAYHLNEPMESDVQSLGSLVWSWSNWLLWS